MWFLIWVTALLAGSLYAKDRDQGILLRGTVGAAAVVMQLGGDHPWWGNGVYFYEKYRQDIALQGSSISDDALDDDSTAKRYQFKEYDTDDMGNTGHFDLTRDGDSFKGTFTLGEKTVPVALRVVAPDSIPNPQPDLNLNEPLSDYEKLKLAGIQFSPGKTETVRGKYTIQWFTEPRSQIAVFRVTGGYPEPVMRAINRVIDAEAYGGALGYLGCSFGGKPGAEPDIITGYYLSDRFVSYRKSFYSLCDGMPHSEFGTYGITIDARTGKKLTLEDVYWLGTGNKPKLYSEAWFKYRSEVFEPKVAKLLQKLYPEQVEEYGCDEPFRDGLWYFTAKGLYIGYCTQGVYSDSDTPFPSWSVIPWRILKKNNPDLDGE